MNKKLERLLTAYLEEGGKQLKLTQVSELFLKDRRTRVAPDTMNFYTKYLSRMNEFFLNMDVVSTEDLTHDVLHTYIIHEQDRGIKNNTINKGLRSLKSALSYCVKIERLDENPMRNFDLLNKDDVETITIDYDVSDSIFNFINSAPRTQYNLRLKAILYLLLDTGVRKNELRNIKLSDLDLRKNTIYLKKTKTRKNRHIFLSMQTTRVIEEYLSSVEPIEYLFETVDGRAIQLSSNRLDQMILKLKRKLNLPSEVSISFHKFRHTYATRCLDHGAHLEFIRKTLGHSSISTTQKYLHLSTDKLKEQHEMHSPIAMMH